MQCLISKNMCYKKLTKDVNVKAFNMKTNKNETKTRQNHIECDCKYKFNSATCNSNQKWIIKPVNVNVKITISAKKIIVGILAHVFERIASFVFTNKNDGHYSNECINKLS